MKYRVLGPAEKDIQRIDDWIAGKFGESHAIRAVATLHEVFQSLADHHGLGVERPDLTARPVRFFFDSHNWIIYEPGNPLLIHRVFPARMDIRRLRF